MTYRSRPSPHPGRYAYVAQYQSPVSRRQSMPAAQKSRRSMGRKSFIILALALFVFTGLHITASRHASAHALAIRQAQEQADAARTQRLSTLDATINQIIESDTQVNYSIAIQEIDSDHPSDVRQLGSTGTSDAASTGKLITASDYLHHVAEGKASLNQQIDGESAQQWLQAMIIKSDDKAWEELNGYLTHDGLASYAESIGIKDYDADTNKLSSRDIAQVLQKLYDKQLLPSSQSNLLLSYLKQANYRDYIVPAVPEGDTVYHKVGLDNDDVNDAAIITHGQQALVVVIFTDGNGTYNWPDRAGVMQQITKAAMTAYFL